MLRKAALHCESKDLDDAFMDRIVCRVCDMRLQWCLISKADLTLQKAIKEAVAVETAEHSTQEIWKAHSTPSSKRYNTMTSAKADRQTARTKMLIKLNQSAEKLKKPQQPSMCRLQQSPSTVEVLFPGRHLSVLFKTGAHHDGLLICPGIGHAHSTTAMNKGFNKVHGGGAS